MGTTTEHDFGGTKDGACFGYKLYDEKGIVVTSSTIHTSAIKVGERTKETLVFYVGEYYDLQEGKTYRMELLNVS